MPNAAVLPLPVLACARTSLEHDRQALGLDGRHLDVAQRSKVGLHGG